MPALQVLQLAGPEHVRMSCFRACAKGIETETKINGERRRNAIVKKRPGTCGCCLSLVSLSWFSAYEVLVQDVSLL